MQVDDATITKYQEIPELLPVTTQENGINIMQKCADGNCIKLENGLCAIQQKYGEEMLSDACAMYPRISRDLGDFVVMTATISCPEIEACAVC